MTALPSGAPAKFVSTSSPSSRSGQRLEAAKKLLSYSPVLEADFTRLAPPSPMPVLRSVRRTGNLLICVFVLGFGIWSAFAPLKSAAIAAGVVEPEFSRKTIQHLEGGIIRQILVKNGDTVTSGQVLIELDDTKSRSDRDSIQGQLWDAEGCTRACLPNRAIATRSPFHRTSAR